MKTFVIHFATKEKRLSTLYIQAADIDVAAFKGKEIAAMTGNMFRSATSLDKWNEIERRNEQHFKNKVKRLCMMKLSKEFPEAASYIEQINVSDINLLP